MNTCVYIYTNVYMYMSIHSGHHGIFALPVSTCACRFNVYIFVYVYTHIYTHIYVYVYVYMYIYIYTHTYIYIYICVYIHVYIYTHMYTYICVYEYVYMYIHNHKRKTKTTQRVVSFWADKTFVMSPVLKCCGTMSIQIFSRYLSWVRARARARACLCVCVRLCVWT